MTAERDFGKDGLWDPTFLFGRSKPAAVGGYLKDFDRTLQRRSKADLMRQLADMQLKVPVVTKTGKASSAVAASCRPLYLQHAMILLADHGSAERMRLMGVTGLEESSAMGGGVPGVLNLLVGHRLGLGRAAELAPDDLHAFAQVERELWRAAALELGFTNVNMPPCLRKNSKGKWIKIPECFYDLLCETRKLLNGLRNGGPPQQSRGWSVAEAGGRSVKRRRRA